MTTMSYIPPTWVTQAAEARARAVRIRRCLILTAVLAVVVILGALGL